MKANVLIIEDELSLAELIAMYLNKEGIDIRIAGSAEEAQKLLAGESFDLITLDINLPGKDGFEFLHHFRRNYEIPVIIVSAREADEDIIMGLGVGADEFVTKPFAPRVLAARIRAMLRRVEQGASGRNVIRFAGYSMDIDGFLLKRGEDRVKLSAREFEVLAFLAQNPGTVFSTDEIYSSVWGNAYGDITTVGVYVQRLRRKLEDDPSKPIIIETFPGRGYRFSRDVVE